MYSLLYPQVLKYDKFTHSLSGFLSQSKDILYLYVTQLKPKCVRRRRRRHRTKQNKLKDN